MRYAKLMPHLERHGWQFHFVGPSPELSSLHSEPVHNQAIYCHYTSNVSRSRQYSIRKNRQPRGSLNYLLYAVLQAWHRRAETIVSHDGFEYMKHGLIAEATAAHHQHNYQLVAGISPDFPILETALQVAHKIDRPFVAIYDDPHGHRDLEGFYPAEAYKQRDILNQAAAAIFASPLTRQRYAECGLLDVTDSFFLSDCYPSEGVPLRRTRVEIQSSLTTKSVIDLVHLGNIGSWRPIGPLLLALTQYLESGAPGEIHLSIYGLLYKEAIKKIRSTASLRRLFSHYHCVTHEQSHSIADKADILLVVIGPLHMDNLPSKFFEYLGHGTPLLVLGPPGNPLESIVSGLGIGIYCNVNDSSSIKTALEELVLNYNSYCGGFRNNQAAIEAYSSSAMARNWAATFSRILYRQRGSASVS